MIVIDNHSNSMIIRLFDNRMTPS